MGNSPDQDSGFSGGRLSFGANPAKKDRSSSGAVADESLLAEIRDLSRRTRTIEERYGNIRKSLQVNEQNMISASRKNSVEIKSINSELFELKKNIRDIGQEIGQMIKELKETVKKEDIKVLEKYITLWQPMNYVTYSEMEKNIRKIVKEESSGKTNTDKTKGL